MIETMDARMQKRADVLFEEQKTLVHVGADRMFGLLLCFEWMAGIAVALWVSPRAWSGATSEVHSHVWTSIILGGLIVCWPIYLSLRHPGKTITRHVVAVGQMLYSALLIHLTGGRIETHFHVFGSLAFLSFYRDWRVLVSATVVVAADHILRGWFFPQSVYGIAAVQPLRWLEHAWWVVFEDFFLFNACLENLSEMRKNAKRQAEVELTRDSVEELVAERTKQLRESEHDNKQLAHIVHSAGEAIVGQNLEGVVTSWNKGAEQLLGFTCEEMKGRPSERLVPSEKVEEYLEHIHRVAQGETLEPLETVRLRKDGTSVEVSISISPVCDEESRIVGCSVFMRDITERKAAEKRVSEFYSIVSHELRTPLTSIRGALGLIEGGIVSPDSPQLMELVTVARGSSDRLIRLINDMLDLKKIEAGKMEFSKQKVSAADAVRKTVDSLLGVAEETKVKLRCGDLCDEAVHADWDKIVQVLTNLGSNAIKFSNEGDEVVFDAKPVEGNRIRFTVTDTGCGIADEHKIKLFDKFHQIDSSDSRQKGGTGLGLAICRAIVEQHKGDIGLESVVGEGSTFWFEIPLFKAPVRLAAQQRVAGSNWKGRVLLVEDDDELAIVIGAVIKNQGYRFIRAGTLAEAREFLDDSVPDVVILDLSLPDGNGLDLLASLKANPRTVGTPVIVSTGQQCEEKVLGNATIVDWLLKPFDTEMLTKAVERALKIPGRCKVLVVDDDSDTRTVLSTQLRAAGLDCIEARDGHEAIYLTRKEAPDVIVLDVQMPHVDGFQVVEVLKNEELAASTPLVIYSGRDLSSAERDALKLGVTKHLTKGRHQWELSDTIDELLGEVLTSSGT